MALVEPAESTRDGSRRIRLANPATLEPLGAVELAGEARVRDAILLARKAQPAWAELGFDGRGRLLRRALEVLLGRQEEFIDRIVSETGKPRSEVLASEILPACDALEFHAKRARRVLADRKIPLHLLKHKQLRITYRPLGVVGIITPWNVPFLLALNPTVQALIAGNAVVLKPSEVTPRSGQLVGELFEAAGLPEGVLGVLCGDGETGAALVEGGVDKISFTGSARTGLAVAEVCGRNLVPCTLELGGKDPMIVCADADLERAANAAVFGAFANAGQVCTSIERVYVLEAVADDFIDRVVRKTAALRQGAGGEFDVGPMICREQLEVVERQVRAALEGGARALTGGRRNPNYPGLFYEPTVLVDLTHDMEVMREETFGPVLPILRVPSEPEAIRLANDTVYGLNASIFTRDRRKGIGLAKQIRSGAAVVNDCMLTYALPEAPFGGVKRSGIGRVNGEEGLKSYCEQRSIAIDRFGAKSEPIWYPYSARKTRWLQRLMRLVWESPLGRWLS
ncbi:MAG: aldehyde dehydrogenase family protein [Deltaproteobacteria bacterium]|nr:MAG: aldehyde dehydrogenase family protein [Deltaproteobacteria bacterium]